MGVTKAYHRPLVSGIRITSAKKSGSAIANGTLTGLATRNSDGKKVLVTNLHVMTGSVQTNPSGGEEMYQELVSADKKVGSLLAWVPIASAQGQNNIADVAMCELDENVDAEFILHDHPNHSSRQIIEGVMEPREDMELAMLGAVNGEGAVTVFRVDQMVTINDRTFTGLAVLDCTQRTMASGDSGSACLYKVKDGRYRISCIAFAGSDPDGRIGWAFPASVAERELGITFGNRAPTADAGQDQTVDTGATVTLRGSGTDSDTDDTLNYSWEQPASYPWEQPVGSSVILSSASIASPTFTAPSTPTTLTFVLTVEDNHGNADTDTVTISVIQTTAEEAVRKYDANNDGLIQKSEVAKAIGDYLFNGKASKKEVYAVIARYRESVPPDAPAGLTATPGNAGITLRWNNPDNPSITRYEYRLRPGTNAWGSWTTIPGSGPTTVTYVITGLTNGTAYAAEVRAVNAQGTGESAQAGPVTPSVSNGLLTPTPTETWGTWTDTGSTQGCGPTRKKEQSRTSNFGNTETRWVDSPEPETWGPWTDTGRVLGSGAERVKEQSRTSSCDNRETRWVGDSDLH